MIGRRFAGSPDLALAAGISLATIFAALIPFPDIVRALVVLPTVLIAAGYAVSAALFAPNVLGRELRLILSVTLSISVIVVAVVAAQVVVPMHRPELALLVAAITLAATWLALQRRPLNASPAPPPRSRLRPSPLAVVTFVVAIGLGCWAVALAGEKARDQLHASNFTSLWLVPGEAGPTVGVENHEGEGVAYRLVVRQGNTVVGSWKLRLGRGRAWTRSLSVPPPANEEALAADLFREGSPYRTATLSTGGA